MSHLSKINFEFQANPPLPQGTSVGIKVSPSALVRMGFNMLVEISTSSAFSKQSPVKNMAVWAHFDTGASNTTIDKKIADHLHLISVGKQTISTANGKAQTDNYAIDLLFLNSALKGRQNFQVGSCNLNFDLEQCLQNQNQETNFGILIGRDLMASWNIVWNGPTSMVFVSD